MLLFHVIVCFLFQKCRFIISFFAYREFRVLKKIICYDAQWNHNKDAKTYNFGSITARIYYPGNKPDKQYGKNTY